MRYKIFEYPAKTVIICFEKGITYEYRISKLDYTVEEYYDINNIPNSVWRFSDYTSAFDFVINKIRKE